MNLLEETISELAIFGKKPSDIIFISYYQLSDNKEVWCRWEDFEKMANENYYNYRNNSKRHLKEVNGTLKIVGDGWFMERKESPSGLELWVFKGIPNIKLDNYKVPTKNDLFPYWSKD